MEWRKKKNKFFLCLDIGTEAVKALIFSVSNGKIIISGTGLHYFDKYDVFNGKFGCSALSGEIAGWNFEIEVIKRTISKAIEKAKQIPISSLINKEIEKQKKLQVLLGLPADILRARIVYQSFLREKPKEKISKAKEKTICSNVFKSAKQDISQRFAEEFGILPKDIYWVSLKILEIKIDGYLVPALKGYEGKKIEFKVLATFLPKYYWKSIKKIFDSFQFDTLRIVHLAEILPIICKNERKDGIFLDLGGEITQIFEIKNGKLQSIDEFQHGGKAFTESLSQRLGLDEERVRIMKEKYSKRLLSKEATIRIKEILLQEKETWYNSLKSKLKNINFSVIFLFGGASSLPEIQEALEEAAVHDQDSLSVSGLSKVGFICLEDLDNIEDTTKKIKSPQIIPSLLICYYAQENF